MILLGGMLHDLECYVDNCLKFDDAGNVIGRNGGIRGWLADNLPELLPKYKTLMRYKALAIRLRQATGTKDPKPTSKLLIKPFHKAVARILAEEEPVFAHVFVMVEQALTSRAIAEMPDAAMQNVFDRGSKKRRRVNRMQFQEEVHLRCDKSMRNKYCVAREVISEKLVGSSLE
jgi:hypothetical protein